MTVIKTDNEIKTEKTQDSIKFPEPPDSSLSSSEAALNSKKEKLTENKNTQMGVSTQPKAAVSSLKVKNQKSKPTETPKNHYPLKISLVIVAILGYVIATAFAPDEVSSYALMAAVYATMSALIDLFDYPSGTERNRVQGILKIIPVFLIIYKVFFSN
ncbi:hypothetical protein MI048_08550 [Pantoea agglomerans]|uniref:hypothetical protein n=1 Tax=Enterobacter agglomerans TaxID=549 RepID=UPI00177E64F9|nr:hypothetical protein [Pantoea agglomerans]MBD8262642.1 hypothetical protein [Pantoea agglomerans]